MTPMRARVFLAVLFAMLMVPAVAGAKGPDQATIDGEGMVAPVSVGGTEGQDDDLSTLADVAGIWPAAYPQTPDPMLAEEPTEDLGPKLEITWRLPNGGPTPVSVTQELYLYAEGGPLTYTPPGQELVEGGLTSGGWFRTPARHQPTWDTFDLPSRATLEGASAPAPSPAPPVSDADGGMPLWPGIVALVAAGLGAVAAIASRGALVRRVRVGST
jgi:hypothetical protein